MWGHFDAPSFVRQLSLTIIFAEFTWILWMFVFISATRFLLLNDDSIRMVCVRGLVGSGPLIDSGTIFTINFSGLW